jgi:hypothetical protein
MIWDGDSFCNSYWNVVMAVLLVCVVVVESREEEGGGVFNAQALGGNLCNGTTTFRGLMLCLCACCQPVCTWEPVNRALLRLLSAFWSYQLEWWSTARSLKSILQRTANLENVGSKIIHYPEYSEKSLKLGIKLYADKWLSLPVRTDGIKKYTSEVTYHCENHTYLTNHLTKKTHYVHKVCLSYFSEISNKTFLTNINQQTHLTK